MKEEKTEREKQVEKIKGGEKLIKSLKRQKGITLIALVITIIVLIILAAVSISMLTGENGILTKANEAKEAMERANILEEIQIKVFSKQAETAKTQITETDMEDILEQYGTLIYEEDGTTLKGITTSKGNHEILLTEVYQGTTSEQEELVTNPETGLKEMEAPVQTTTVQFTKAYGVIEVAFIDISNNIISTPTVLTTDDLGGLIPIKWSALSEGTESTTTVNDSGWYSYIKKTGNTDGQTSKWANACTSDNNAYFVWIPRYAYKIIYFDTATSKNNYKTGSGTYTIVGYSTVNGMVDITSGTPKLVEETIPVNITETVKTAGYRDYIPHPAFEFDGAKKGIWVGKYESSTSASTVTIKPDVTSLKTQTASIAYTAAIGLKTTYGLIVDSHLMKNIEWGVVAYLTESRYGRNGTEVTINNSSNYYTGRAGESGSVTSSSEGTYQYNTVEGVLASTTGNVYGIYDISGGIEEYVAGYVNNNNSRLITNGSNIVNSVSKYKDVYTVSISDTNNNNYNKNKNIYGDGVYETSTNGSNSLEKWNNDNANFPYINSPFFLRGGGYNNGSSAGVFAFRESTGYYLYGYGFRIVLCVQ